MKALEEKILNEGVVLEGNILKVGSFLNQQIDVELLTQMGKEISEIYKNCGATKILTIESSGIAIAVGAGMVMGIPVIFAKKHKSANVSGNVYTTQVYSYTHKEMYSVVLGSDYLKSDDKVIIIDDFLANGKAVNGLIDIVNQAGAMLLGVTCAIEKGFQGGGDKLREQGIRVESLAVVDKLDPITGIEFR